MDRPTLSYPSRPRKLRRVGWITPRIPPRPWETDFFFLAGPLSPRLLPAIGVLAGSVGAALLVDAAGYVIGVRGPSSTWDQMTRELQRRISPARGGAA
jgi:hypothetical protein